MKIAVMKEQAKGIKAPELKVRGSIYMRRCAAPGPCSYGLAVMLAGSHNIKAPKTSSSCPSDSAFDVQYESGH
jgi:hypothetical protein